MVKIIWIDGPYRIIERDDCAFSLDDLCGDMYRPECHPDIPKDTLERELKAFTDLVESEGVFGYELQKSCPLCKTWTHVDSCYGFVGQYDASRPEFNHYIVDELKALAGYDAGIIFKEEM